ncbi:MAG: hypothetical protein JSV25_15145 [Spirochaetota bacterium]|nr:MAG: hypothetical protein JSV25_15145 [Spirochaetota bacterium]
MILADNLKTYFQLVFALRNFLKETLSLEQCKEIVKKRLEYRDKNFIEIVKRNIYENEKSPYLKLLKHAGCEFGDFRSCVLREGIEKTLERLHGSGVYLTYDEFKGRKEVIRGGKTFRFEQSDFNNPTLSHHLTVQTGGITGPGVEAAIDFRSYTQTAVHRGILFDIYELWNIPFAIWFPILPGSAGIGYLLHSTKVGKVPSKWFSQVDREYIKPSFKHKFRTNGLIYAGRLFGISFPKPDFIDLNSAYRVARWVSQMVRDYSGCFIATYPSSAVRICLAAKDNSMDIEGTKFIVSGEPLTSVKRDEIRSIGAEVIPQYSFTEARTVGFGCAEPAEIDEVHLLKDSFALIQNKRKIPYTDLTVNAFLFTTLLNRAHKILLNVEVGDYGVVKSRKCGCGFEDAGLDVHIHSIRSFEKLTSEGMNLAEVDLTRIIDEVLPQKYGGNSTDYQILEEEDTEGLTHLSIAVSPGVGEINEKDLVKTILEELRNRGGTMLIRDVFSQANVLHVKRIYPISTKRGKILPLHIDKQRYSS